MKILFTIVGYTLKGYLSSLRLLLGFVIVVFLMASGAVIYSLKYQQETVDYRGKQIDQDIRIGEESHSLASVITMDLDAYRQPRPLQFIVDGGEGMMPDKIPFTVNLVNSPTREGGLNYMLPPFEGVDWDFIVRVVLSFVAIALTYDSVSGERERGTLRMIMANPVPRDRLLTGKFLAALIALAIPLFSGAIISSAIVTVYGGILLRGSDVVLLLAHLVLSMAYIAVFILLGILVSTHTRKSASSLVILLLIWVCFVIAIPGMARPMAIMSMELPSRKEFDDEVSQIFDDVMSEYKGRDVSHAPPDVAPIDDSEYLWAEMMENVDEREQRIVDHYWLSKLEQARLARRISTASPAGLYRFAGQDLLDAGLIRQEGFMGTVRAFRQSLADFGRERDSRDPESPHILYREWYMSQRPVDPDDVPRYRDGESDEKRGQAEGLKTGLWLVVEALLLFVAAYTSFLRSDVR